MNRWWLQLPVFPATTAILAGVVQLAACSSAETVARNDARAEQVSAAEVEVIEWQPNVTHPVRSPGQYGRSTAANSYSRSTQQNPWAQGRGDDTREERWWAGYQQPVEQRADQTCIEPSSSDKRVSTGKLRPWGDVAARGDAAVEAQPANIWNRNAVAPPEREANIWSQNDPGNRGWQARQAERSRPVYSW